MTDFILNLERVLPIAAKLTPLPLLVRAYSGLCSLKIMQEVSTQATALSREIAFIIKWNPRSTPVEAIAAQRVLDANTTWCAATTGARAAPVSALAAFLLGFLTNITNRQSALFFGSVFASAFPPQPDGLLQVSAMATIVVNVLCWLLLLAFLFSRGHVRAPCARSRHAANRIASAVIGGLGLGLLAG